VTKWKVVPPCISALSRGWCLSTNTGTWNDELMIHVAPVLLGSGTRLFEHVDGSRVKLQPLPGPASPAVTHLRHRVVRWTRRALTPALERIAAVAA
jgi:hypothetical protein